MALDLGILSSLTPGNSAADALSNAKSQLNSQLQENIDSSKDVIESQAESAKTIAANKKEAVQEAAVNSTPINKPNKEIKAPSIDEELANFAKSLKSNIVDSALGDIAKLKKSVEGLFDEMNIIDKGYKNFSKSVALITKDLLEITNSVAGMYTKFLGILANPASLATLNQYACILEKYEDLMAAVDSLIARIANLAKTMLDMLNKLVNLDPIFNAAMGVLEDTLQVLNHLMSNRNTVVSCNSKPMGPTDILIYQGRNLPISKQALSYGRRFLSKSKVQLTRTRNELMETVRIDTAPITDRLSRQAKELREVIKENRLTVETAYKELKERLLPT